MEKGETMASKALKVPPARVAISGSKTRVESPALATALIQNPDEALRILQRDAPGVKLTQVSVAKDGRVVIDNPNLARAIRDRLRAGGSKANNGICGLGCGAA